jgi:hypothetical protein
VVASANYVNGAWIYGGYYQHATGAGAESQSRRDSVDIGELGVSCLIDRNHHLLGMNYYTDVKLFVSIYYYRFNGTDGPAISNIGAAQNGVVFVVGGRFAFF